MNTNDFKINKRSKKPYIILFFVGLFTMIGTFKNVGDYFVGEFYSGNYSPVEWVEVLNKLPQIILISLAISVFAYYVEGIIKNIRN